MKTDEILTCILYPLQEYEIVIGLPVHVMVARSIAILDSVGYTGELFYIHLQLFALLHASEEDKDILCVKIEKEIGINFVIVANRLFAARDLLSALELNKKEGVLVSHKCDNIPFLYLIYTLVIKEHLLSNMVVANPSVNRELLVHVEPYLDNESKLKKLLCMRAGCMYHADTRTMLKSIYNSIYFDNVMEPSVNLWE